MEASFMPAPWPAQPGKSGVGGDWIYGVCKARKDSTFAGAGICPGFARAGCPALGYSPPFRVKYRSLTRDPTLTRTPANPR